MKLIACIYLCFLACLPLPTLALDGTWVHQGDSVKIWQSPIEQKVRMNERLSSEAPVHNSVKLSAAKGEWEVVSLIVEVSRNETLQNITISELRTAKGSILPPERWVKKLGEYLHVRKSTAPLYPHGYYPDPLVPFSARDVEPEKNQIVWLEVKIPLDAQAGNYRGAVSLKFSESGRINLPIGLRIYDFSLPKQMHLRSAYAVWPEYLARYHNVAHGSPQLRRVFQSYLKAQAEHHLDPINPALNADQVTYSLPDYNWPYKSVVNDPAGSHVRNRVLVVADDSPRSSVLIPAKYRITIPENFERLKFHWKAKSPQPGPALVSFNQHRVDGSWIPHKNIDFVRDVQRNWQNFSAVITRDTIDPDAKTLQIFVYARAWTPEGELRGTTYFDDFVLTQDGEIKNMIAQGDFEDMVDAAHVEPVLNFARFDEAVQFAIDELNIKNFSALVPGAPRGGWKEINWPDFFGLSKDDPEYRVIMNKIVGAYVDHLREKNWLDMAYAYAFDEPFPEVLPQLAQALNMISNAGPGLKRLVTIAYNPILEGTVDIWSPVLHNFSADWAQHRQSLGEHVWWYVCTIPKHPYPGNFVDQPGIDHRIRFWMMWKYQVEGSLYWNTVFWSERLEEAHLQNPWEDPQSYLWNEYELGNGDGRLFYPPKNFADGKPNFDEPIPSIRLKLIREGFEDYEYMWQLRELSERIANRPELESLRREAQELLDLPNSIVKSLNEFNRNPGEVHAYRDRVAVTLEKLSLANAALY